LHDYIIFHSLAIHLLVVKRALQQIWLNAALTMKLVRITVKLSFYYLTSWQ